MPHNLIFKHRQTLRIHFLHLARLSIGRKLLALCRVLFRVRVASSSRSGSAGEAGGGRRGQVGGCRGGEVRSGVDDLVL